MRERIARVHQAPRNFAAAAGEAYLQNRWNSSLSKQAPTLFNLETAVGRARVSCDAVGWQGQAQACPALRLGWTLRAHAREEEQRSQRAAARLNRVRSALTQPVKAVVR